MLETSEEKLLKLNKTYYDTAGEFWNQDPNYAWGGWYLLRSHILDLIERKGDTITVLDIGAGNGRWYHFLKREFPRVTWIYTAIDSSDFGRSGYMDSDCVTFLHADIFSESWVQNTFDLVVAFGLLHHIPGKRLQLKFLKQFVDSIGIGGLGVFTTWQYMRLERLKKRIISGNERLKLCNALKIDEGELDVNDNFLSWVKGIESIRFSHYFDRDEVMDIMKKLSQVTIIDAFLADDRESNRNEYFVLSPKLVDNK